MAKVCHKALSAVLSVVLAAGLLPCLAWGEEPAASVSQQSIQFGQTIAAGKTILPRSRPTARCGCGEQMGMASWATERTRIRPRL